MFWLDMCIKNAWVQCNILILTVLWGDGSILGYGLKYCGISVAGVHREERIRIFYVMFSYYCYRINGLMFHA